MQNPSLFRIESNLELHDLEYNDDSLSLSSIFSEYSFGSESLEHLQSVANDIYALEMEKNSSKRKRILQTNLRVKMRGFPT